MHRATGASLTEADQPTGAGQHQQAGETRNRDSGDLTQAGRAEVVGVSGPVRRRRDDGVVGREDPVDRLRSCLLYTSPSPRDGLLSRMPSSA